METILACCEKGLPLLHLDITDAVEILIYTVSKQGREKISFKDSCPGRKFVDLLLQRQSPVIKIGRPPNEQEMRYCSWNADTLTTHFAALKKIMEKNNIDNSRMCNNDDIESTPEREANGRINKSIF